MKLKQVLDSERAEFEAKLCAQQLVMRDCLCFQFLLLKMKSVTPYSDYSNEN